jgi:hypothetical protein
MTKLSRVLAAGMAAAAIAGLSTVSAQEASASPVTYAKTTTSAGPQAIGRYAGCMFRVNQIQGTNFNTGISNFILQYNWEVYSEKDQDVNQNLWYVYSYSFGISGWVDWHDLTLSFCDPH